MNINLTQFLPVKSQHLLKNCLTKETVYIFMYLYAYVIYIWSKDNLDICLTEVL